MEKTLIKNFIKYVGLNIMGMIGLSCYILADTFFIAKALGAEGITALNFSIPVYSVIHGIGLMIGIGGATRYSILRARKEDKKAGIVFSACIKSGILIGVILAITGLLGSKNLALILGADISTLTMTKTYLRVILCFAPFFIMNNILLAFVRNDNNPNLSMVAMLTGSFSNIILDYLFMFPLKMGMFGAAFATGLAPIISVLILLFHFAKGKNNFVFVPKEKIRAYVLDIFSLGLSAFITEVSSAIVLITFNLVILSLKGNIGVAAYGIIANIALVGIAIFTGIAQGAQPLISKAYGLKNYKVSRKVLKYALLTSFIIASIMYFAMYFNVDGIIGVFNSQHNMEIVEIAKIGFRIYFMGFIFAGINIVMAMYLSATERAKAAFVISVARGCIIIVPMVVVLSRILDMSGVWLAFVLTECIVTVFVVLKYFFSIDRIKVLVYSIAK